MGPWINYHHLFYFKTIAEEQSVSKAAQKLRLGQPTLSAQLKQFEDNIGVKLFEREHKKLILTEQGKIALDYAVGIFAMGSEMYEVLHDKLKPQRPSVCIGALDSIPKQVILSMVQFALKLTRCHVTLVEGRSDELVRELLGHRVDILITNFIPTTLESRKLIHRSIAKNRVNFYGSSKFKYLKSSFPRCLADHPVLLPTFDSKIRYDLDHWSKQNDVQFDVLTESQDIAIRKLMAINGLGLLPTAEYSVHRQLKNGELFEIGKLEGVSEELFVVGTGRKIENSIAKELLKNFRL